METTAADSRFREVYGDLPAFTVRAPGSFDLVGDDSDCALLPVLGLAVDRFLDLAVSPTADGTVEVHLPSSFAEPYVFRRDALADVTHGEIEGRLVSALRRLGGVAPGAGARCVIASSLPPDGGIGSFAALTCGFVAGLLTGWSTPTPERVAEAVLAAHRDLGQETGGAMCDVILHARAGQALRVDFLPPGRRFVGLPAGLRLVVARMPDAAGTSAEMALRHHERGIGARIGAAWLADLVGLEAGEVSALGEIAGIDELELLVDELPESISALDAGRHLGLKPDRFTRPGKTSITPTSRVPVRPFARYALGEAARVDRAEQAVVEGDLATLGDLLDESHRSLREDVRWSTRALNRLCRSLREAGASGARPIAAGLQGYAVAACLPEEVDGVVAAAADAGGSAFEVRPVDALRIES